MSNITVIIPTSPIPSHPSTAILNETVFNVRKYTDAEIIIMMDGVHSSLVHRTEDYEKYRNAVIETIEAGEYGNCWAIDFEHHRHQAEMTRHVLKEHVKTPLILFCEHDTSPVGDIPFQRLCHFVEESGKINYMRFNIFDRILDEHQYLMLDKTPIRFEGVRFVRTIQWSQRPHIAKVSWYRDLLFTYFRDHQKTMIEDVMHGIVEEKYKDLGFDTFGLTIYTPEGSQLRSYHSDARGSDEKIITG